MAYIGLVLFIASLALLACGYGLCIGRKAGGSVSLKIMFSIAAVLMQLYLSYKALFYLHILYPNLWLFGNLCFSLALTAYCLYRFPPSAGSQPIPLPSFRQCEAGIFAGWLGLAIFMFIRAIHVPELTIDALDYHITAGVSGFFNPPEFAHDFGQVYMNPSVKDYPILGEVLNAWAMTFPGGIENSKLGSTLMVILGSAAVMMMSRSLGISRVSTFLVGLIYLISPVLFGLSQSGYVDGTAVAMLLGALASLLLIKDFNPLAATTVFVFVALACNTRINMIPSAFFIVVIYFTIHRKKIFSAMKSSRLFLCIVLGTAFMSAAPYLYNFVVYGNPLHPASLSILGFKFSGLFPEGIFNIGPYGGHLVSGFLDQPAYRQTYHTIIDTANYSWSYAFWSGFCRDWWGNILIWAVIPSLVISFTSEKFRLKAFAFLLFAVVCWVVIPFSAALPRYHLFSGVILLPFVGAALDVQYHRSKTIGILQALFLLVFVIGVGFVVNINASFYRNWADASFSLTEAPRAFPRIPAVSAMALAVRPIEYGRLTVGPGGRLAEYYYMYRHDDPLRSPVDFRMKSLAETFDFSTLPEGSLAVCWKDENNYVRTTGKSDEFKDVFGEVTTETLTWCSKLSSDSNFELLLDDELRQIYLRVKNE